MTELLDVSCQISTPVGWVELEDEVNGLSLHTDTAASRATPRRTTSVDGDWIDGSFAKRSTRGNAVETVAVWVEGATHLEFETRMETVKSYFDQAFYTVKFRIGNAVETWTCPLPGEYTEDTQQAYRFATSGLLRVTVSRLPTKTVEEYVP